LRSRQSLGWIFLLVMLVAIEGMSTTTIGICGDHLNNSSTEFIKCFAINSAKNLSAYKFTNNLTQNIEVTNRLPNGVDKSNSSLNLLGNGTVNLTGSSMTILQTLNGFLDNNKQITSWGSEFFFVNNTTDNIIYVKTNDKWSKIELPREEYVTPIINYVELLNQSTMEIIGSEPVGGEDCYKAKFSLYKPGSSETFSLAALIAFTVSPLSISDGSINITQLANNTNLFNNSEMTCAAWLTKDKYFLRKMEIDLKQNLTPDMLDLPNHDNDFEMKTTTNRTISFSDFDKPEEIFFPNNMRGEFLSNSFAGENFFSGASCGKRCIDDAMLKWLINETKCWIKFISGVNANFILCEGGNLLPHISNLRQCECSLCTFCDEISETCTPLPCNPSSCSFPNPEGRLSGDCCKNKCGPCDTCDNGTCVSPLCYPSACLESGSDGCCVSKCAVGEYCVNGTCFSCKCGPCDWCDVANMRCVHPSCDPTSCLESGSDGCCVSKCAAVGEYCVNGTCFSCKCGPCDWCDVANMRCVHPSCDPTSCLESGSDGCCVSKCAAVGEYCVNGTCFSCKCGPCDWCDVANMRCVHMTDCRMP
jgi:hypothetical protein